MSGTRPTGGDQRDNATKFRDDSSNNCLPAAGIMGPRALSGIMTSCRIGRDSLA
jgi:hypothetical protein